MTKRAGADKLSRRIYLKIAERNCPVCGAATLGHQFLGLGEWECSGIVVRCEARGFTIKGTVNRYSKGVRIF